jgi:hypothetical protein
VQSLSSKSNPSPTSAKLNRSNCSRFWRFVHIRLARRRRVPGCGQHQSQEPRRSAEYRCQVSFGQHCPVIHWPTHIRAKIAFSQTKEAPAKAYKAADEKTAEDGDKEKTKEKEKEKDKSDLELKFDKIKKELGAKNEVSVSVTWTGGGQDLKPRG